MPRHRAKQAFPPDHAASRPPAREPESVWLALTPTAFVLLWSTGYIGAKLGMPYAEPFTFLALRFAAASLLLAGIAYVFGAPWPRGRNALHSMVVGVLIHGVYLGGVFWAIEHQMPAGVAALIVGLQPLMAAMLAGAALGERVTARHWAGLILGLAGIALVLGPKLDLAGSGITGWTAGAVLIGTLSITLGTVYQKRFAVEAGLRAGGALQFAGAFLLCALLAVLNETGRIEWTGEFVFALVWLVVVLSLGAIALLMLLIRRGAVSKVSTVFYLVAPTTALLGWALFGETLSLLQLIGMALTVAGVAVAMERARA